jgi:hypothetical protein
MLVKGESAWSPINRDNGFRSKKMGFETNTVDGSGCCDTRKKMLGCLLTGSDMQELVFKPNIMESILKK